jgi:hypothetical protein
MISIVYLAPRSHTDLVDDLLIAGIQVWEAISVAEVLHLCEYQAVRAVLIASDFNDPELAELRTREITLQLKPDATVQDIVGQLTTLFPGPMRVQ